MLLWGARPLLSVRRRQPSRWPYAISAWRDPGEQLLARLLAATALLGAAPAVLHSVGGVDFALVGAGAARRDARSEHGARDLGVVARPAADDAPRCRADVGAVEVQADAGCEVLDAFLGEAGVRALGARLRAVGAGLDAADEQVGIEAELARVGVEHLAGNVGDGHNAPPGWVVR